MRTPPSPNFTKHSLAIMQWTVRIVIIVWLWELWLLLGTGLTFFPASTLEPAYVWEDKISMPPFPCASFSVSLFWLPLTSSKILSNLNLKNYPTLQSTRAVLKPMKKGTRHCTKVKQIQKSIISHYHNMTWFLDSLYLPHLCKSDL